MGNLPIKIMLNQPIYDNLQLALAANVGQYRLLQNGLREARMAGYTISVKLNGKIDALFDAAYQLTEKWENITPQPAKNEKQRSQSEAAMLRKYRKWKAEKAMELASSLGYIWNPDLVAWVEKPEPPAEGQDERADFAYHHATGQKSALSPTDTKLHLIAEGFEWDGLNWIRPDFDDEWEREWVEETMAGGLSYEECVLPSSGRHLAHRLGVHPSCCFIMFHNGPSLYTYLEALGYNYYGGGQWVNNQQPTEHEPVDWQAIVDM